MNTGHSLKLVESTDFSRFARCVGEIVNFGELYYTDIAHNRWFMKYRVPLEIVKGDTVFFHYYCVDEARIDGYHFTEGEDQYIVVHYEDLYVRIRGEEIYPLNGFVLAEPVEKRYNTSLIVPDIAQGNSENICRITHVGAKISEYNYGRDKYKLPDTKVWPGSDRVVVANKLIPVEDGLWQSILGKKTVYRFQRCDVVGEIIGDTPYPADKWHLIRTEKLDQVRQTASGIYFQDRKNADKFSDVGTVEYGKHKGKKVWFNKNTGKEFGQDNLLFVHQCDMLVIQ